VAVPMTRTDYWVAIFPKLRIDRARGDPHLEASAEAGAVCPISATSVRNSFPPFADLRTFHTEFTECFIRCGPAVFLNFESAIGNSPAPSPFCS
jgi:hypothetical protein